MADGTILKSSCNHSESPKIYVKPFKMPPQHEVFSRSSTGTFGRQTIANFLLPKIIRQDSPLSYACLRRSMRVIMFRRPENVCFSRTVGGGKSKRDEHSRSSASITSPAGSPKAEPDRTRLLPLDKTSISCLINHTPQYPLRGTNHIWLR